MLVFKTIAALQTFLNTRRGSIGFVPTMGALHAGHISLIEQCKSENELTVCSIFVNPLQFNNTTDLEKYPRTLPDDMLMLQQAGCDVLFAPDAQEMYASEADASLDFSPGALDTLFEGRMRPGHFMGVAVVVHKLFRIVQPTHAYFGLKDYQQCMLISKLVRDLKLPVQLHFCPTLREPDGLAMSSRNRRLKAEERSAALRIYEALQYAKSHYRTIKSSAIEDWCKSYMQQSPLYRVEYFNIVSAETLLPVMHEDEPAVALCAAFVGDVRLIDNMILTA